MDLGGSDMAVGDDVSRILCRDNKYTDMQIVWVHSII